MRELALIFWLVYFLLSLGVRVFFQLRRTGTSGLRLMRSRPGSVQWFGETLEAAALAMGGGARTGSRGRAAIRA
jgi:hypothetical protein